MARLGVTYSEVMQAIHQILGQGKTPTIEQIRHLLGTGSSTTIANHLRRWKEEQEQPTLVAIKENLPTELVALVKGLWDRLVESSESKISILEANHLQQVRQLEQELLKYKNNNQRWQHLHNVWVNEKKELMEATLQLETTNNSLAEEKNTLASKHQLILQQLQEKQERIRELNHLHQQAQTNLEHYRASTREQRLIEQQQFSSQKQELKNEASVLQEQIITLREKSSGLEHQVKSLQQSNQLLEQDIKSTKLQIAKQQSDLLELEKIKNEHALASSYWKELQNSTQEKMDKTTQQLFSLQTEAKMLHQQLLENKQCLLQASEQNKLLQEEKWALKQEKSLLQQKLKSAGCELVST